MNTPTYNELIRLPLDEAVIMARPFREPRIAVGGFKEWETIPLDKGEVLAEILDSACAWHVLGNRGSYHPRVADVQKVFSVTYSRIHERNVAMWAKKFGEMGISY